MIRLIIRLKIFVFLKDFGLRNYLHSVTKVTMSRQGENRDNSAFLILFTKEERAEELCQMRDFAISNARILDGQDEIMIKAGAVKSRT